MEVKAVIREKHMRGLAIPAGVALVVASYFFGSEVLGNKPPQDPAGLRAPLPVMTGGSPEEQLTEVFRRIEANQIDAALQQAESLTQRWPNFRLGQLVKGDLLLSRSQPISHFGNASNAPQERLADLKAEALARLNAYRERPAPNTVPRYLLQMQPEQKYAVVVDAERSRLYLFQNTDNGVPQRVHDFYITQGKLGAEKSREGDKKTPVGVYHVTGNLPTQKLGDFYGTGAFPINYPNEWDKRLGRDGHGIWLHGTPSDTYARPPKASDGCVVLANPDLNTLAKYLQVGITPVIISPNVEWVSTDEWHKERQGLLSAINGWRQDWESRDGDRYARNYSRQFKSDNYDYASWVDTKRKINASKEWINIGTEKITLFRYPGREDMVVATFQQDYKSNNLNNSMKKRQYWIKEDGRWKILFEGAA